MKKLLLLLTALLTLGVSGAWADVTVTLADASQDPYNLGTRSNSNKTFTTNADAGLAGVVLDVTGSVDHYTTGTYSGRLALKTAAHSTDETWTLTAPEGYVIKGYSFSATFASSNTATITAGGTAYSISSSAYTDVAVSGLKVKNTSFTVNASSTDWIAFGPFTVTLAKIDFVSLTFDKPGFATNNITVNVKDADGDAIPGVTASLESTSCTEFKTGSAAALSRTTNSVLAPNAGYDNSQDATITYTFKVEGLPSTFTYNKAALDVYALTGSGGAQGNTGNTAREWTFDVETGATTDALASFVRQADNDICTVEDADGDLYHKLWTMSGSDKAATDALYIKVTLTKTVSLGCYAGIGEVQLYKPGATVQYVISDASGVVFTSEAVNTSAGTNITELPAAYQRPYCTYSAINETMAEGENTVNVTVTAYAPPFTVSSSFAEATWYYATLRGKQLRADESAKDGSGRYSTSSSNERTDVYKWAFVGNPYNLSIINKGAGSSKVLYAGDVPVMQAATPASDDKARWVVSSNSNGGFTVRSESGANLYINDAGGNGNLGYWNSTSGVNDAGSNWVVTEVSVSDKAALGETITTANSLYTTLNPGAGTFGYPTSAALSTFNTAIATAQAVYDDANGDYYSGYTTLLAAIETLKAAVIYTPRTDVYYTIVNARGAMVYDPSHDESVDAKNDNAKYLWYGSTTPNDADVNNLWGFIEQEGNYYMYNVGKQQFASVGTGTYGSTWIFSDTPAYITLDDGIADEIAAPKMRIQATIATTLATYTMSVSTSYTGPVITYDAANDGGVPMTFAESATAVDATVTDIMVSKVTDLTPYKNALKDVIDGCASIPLGSGLNQYTSNSTYTDALAAANTAYENSSATKSELQTAMSNLESAIAGLSLNMPAANKFYRIEGQTSSTYLAADMTNGKFAMTTATDATTIFYFDGSQLVNLSSGMSNGMTRSAWAWVTGENASTVVFQDGLTNGGYAIKSATANFYDSGDAETNPSADRGDNITISSSTNARFTNWYLTEVTTLPITISSAGYATLYAPVALTIPTGVKAYYVSALTADEATLTEIFTTIPANTGVILEASQGTYDFEKAETVAAISGNKLSGVIAATAFDDDEAYTLQQNKDQTDVGLYGKAAGTLAGFKAYLPANDVPAGVKGFTFVFEGADGINEIANGKSVNGKYFDLSGRRVNAVTKGLYIMNGKKVIK